MRSTLNNSGWDARLRPLLISSSEYRRRNSRYCSFLEAILKGAAGLLVVRGGKGDVFVDDGFEDCGFGEG